MLLAKTISIILPSICCTISCFVCFNLGPESVKLELGRRPLNVPFNVRDPHTESHRKDFDDCLR